MKPMSAARRKRANMEKSKLETSLIKAVFVDFDGTTFRHDNYEIPPSTSEALKKMKQNGIKLGLLTSRAPEETIHLPAEFIALMDVLLWSAGSVVIENGNTQITTIDPEDVALAIGYARQNQLVVRYSTGKEGYFDQWTDVAFTEITDKVIEL